MLQRYRYLLALFAIGAADLAVAQADTNPASVQTAQPTSLVGKVVEQIPAPPYVYLRLQTSSGEVWAAVSQAPIGEGSTVAVSQSMLLRNFKSKTLDRTFPEIYFGMLQQSGAGAAANPHGIAQSAPVAAVAKASGADARSVEQVWAQAAQLSGKTVLVRGQVVKYNPAVMGKNWVHIQDGSGAAAQGNQDLTVTTLEEAAIGDIVTISGVLHADKDFGAGYRYALIIEDAKLSKE